MTEPTPQQLTIASCRTLVRRCSSTDHHPETTVCHQQAQRLLELVSAPLLDASAIRDFVESLVTELEMHVARWRPRTWNEAHVGFAADVCESLCLLDLYPPSEDGALRRRVLAAWARGCVLYYEGLVADNPKNDTWNHGLRRSQELLDLIRADPPRHAELQRLHQTLKDELWGRKPGSFFGVLVGLANSALETLGGSHGAKARELVKEFELEDPLGTFYTLRRRDVETQLLPVAGFFVDQLTGSVQHFGFTDFFDAFFELSTWDLRFLVGHLLTRPPGPQR